MLSLVLLGLLIACTVHAFLAGDYNRLWKVMSVEQEAGGDDHLPASDVAAQFAAVQRGNRVHTMLGLLISLMGVLINCLSVTYFIGTGRWCKEVVLAYGLDDALERESTRWKRKSFPWALTGVLTTLAMAATGAAADPGTLMRNTEQLVVPHAIVSIGGTILLAVALFRQRHYLVHNQQLIEQIVSRVRGIRTDRGLPV